MCISEHFINFNFKIHVRNENELMLLLRSELEDKIFFYLAGRTQFAS